MRKESWLSGKNDSGDLVQLSKSYHLEKTDDYDSKNGPRIINSSTRVGCKLELIA